MQHIGAVNVLEAHENLVQKVLAVVVGQHLWRLDDLLEVGVHQVVDDIAVRACVRVRESQ